VAEQTGMKTNHFDLVTYGSSFNVCDQQQALKETHRILKPHGYIACMWNYRNLEDPLQKDIERTIREMIPNYSYGSRREDQTKYITQNGLFKNVSYIESSTSYQISAVDFSEGWKSHATLQRQAEDYYYQIIEKIKYIVYSYAIDGIIHVSYTTRVWLAQKTEE
jgi:ubiquinone/menaquinone biosynthesis C-methylase UbiE